MTVFMLVAMRVAAAAFTWCVVVSAVVVSVRSENTGNGIEHAMTVTAQRAVPEDYQVKHVADETDDGCNEHDFGVDFKLVTVDTSVHPLDCLNNEESNKYPDDQDAC